MTKEFCKITSSGRCAKTKNANENDPNCMYNETTKRCNKTAKKKIVEKVLPKKKTQVEQKKKTQVEQKKKIQVEQKKKTQVEQKKKTQVEQKKKTQVQNTIPFHLKNDAKSIEFTGIPEKLFLKNVSNSTEDLNAILAYLKLPTMKSKAQKFLSIKEYISKTLQNFPIKKLSIDTIELNIPLHTKVVYQYNQCKSLSIYSITLLLLYFNIDEIVSVQKKNKLCELLHPMLPIDKKQIEKHLFQKISKIKNCNSLNLKNINDILLSLNIYKTKATKKEKCSIITNIDKLNSTEPYVVLDNEHVLFNTKPKKILYNIYRNILDNKYELNDIFYHLQKHGLISHQLFKNPTLGNNYNKLIKNAVLTKENFPNHIFVEQLQTIPKTPSIPPTVPQQYFLSHKIFHQFSNKMNNCISNYKKPFVSGKYRLIDLIPPQNILKNGRDIRMYHGTKLLHWEHIKNHGIKPIGDGALGKGFYFTPSVPRATNYFFRYKKQQKQKLEPVLIELVIKDADKLKVGDLESEYPIETQIFMTFGKLHFYWQFIVRSEDVIKKHFRIDRVFRLDM